MLQSLGILYAEHALLERKSMTNFQRFCWQKSRRSPTMHSNRLIGVVRSTVLYSEPAHDTCKPCNCTGSSI